MKPAEPNGDNVSAFWIDHFLQRSDLTKHFRSFLGKNAAPLFLPVFEYQLPIHSGRHIAWYHFSKAIAFEKARIMRPHHPGQIGRLPGERSTAKCLGKCHPEWVVHILKPFRHTVNRLSWFERRDRCSIIQPHIPRQLKDTDIRVYGQKIYPLFLSVGWPLWH